MDLLGLIQQLLQCYENNYHPAPSILALGHQHDTFGMLLNMKNFWQYHQ